MSIVPIVPLPGADPRALLPRDADAPQPVLFTGDSGNFARLLVKGAVLELITFGFYRFWLITAMRHHLWSATAVDGDSAEYTGRARELLMGFLVALAILGPLFVGNFLLGIFAERLRAFASLPLAIFYFAFTQFAIYRARRYRLTRTVWRGVRFWMQGSGWHYAWKSFWWAVFATLTFGVALPWRAAALERYKMRNTFYGDLQASFVGTGGGLFKRVWWLWLLVIVPPMALFVGFILYVPRDFDSASQGGIFAAFGLALLVFILLVMLALPIYRASEWQWWLTGLRFGGLSFVTTLKRRSVLWLYAKTMLVSAGVVVLALIALSILGAIIGFAFGLRMDGLAKLGNRGGLHFDSYLGLATIVFSYLSVALMVLVVQRFFLQHQLWRLISQSLTVVGLSGVEHVAARGAAANALGEGLADGLDVAGF